MIKVFNKISSNIPKSDLETINNDMLSQQLTEKLCETDVFENIFNIEQKYFSEDDNYKYDIYEPPRKMFTCRTLNYNNKDLIYVKTQGDDVDVILPVFILPNTVYPEYIVSFAEQLISFNNMLTFLYRKYTDVFPDASNVKSKLFLLHESQFDEYNTNFKLSENLDNYTFTVNMNYNVNPLCDFNTRIPIAENPDYYKSLVQHFNDIIWQQVAFKTSVPSNKNTIIADSKTIKLVLEMFKAFNVQFCFKPKSCFADIHFAMKHNALISDNISKNKHLYTLDKDYIMSAIDIMTHISKNSGPNTFISCHMSFAWNRNDCGKLIPFPAIDDNSFGFIHSNLKERKQALSPK